MSLRVFRFLAVALALATSSVAARANGIPLIYNPLNPSAVSPGGAGFTLTVSGTGFISTAVVNWNGSPRATTFVSSSKLTASILAPDIASASTAIITVTNPGSGGGTSNSLNLQISKSVASTPFANTNINRSSWNSVNLVSSDFNGDGKPDFVTAINTSIYFLPGNGDGTFGTRVLSIGANSTILHVDVADLNNDGKPDLVLIANDGIYTALGRGDGTFQLTSSSLADSPLGVVIADFNSDGNLDLAYTISSGIQVQFGNGDGTFRPGPFTPSSAVNPGSKLLAAGDFNGDGKLDVVVASAAQICNAGSFPIYVILGDGAGSFGVIHFVPGAGQACFSDPGSVVVADFNGDGKLDLAHFASLSNVPGSGDLTISLGNGDGSFQVPYRPLPQPPNNVVGPLVAGDFNADGKLDLVAGNQLLLGNGNGTFDLAGASANPSFVQAVLAGDFNGDGKLDLISKTFLGELDISMLLQLAPAPDFGGSISPSSQQVTPGGSTSFTVNVSALNGFSGSVSLDVAGLPSGVTATFSPNPVTGSGTSTLTLTASNSTALGNYPLTITGTSGAISRSLSASLTVNSMLGDFTGSIQPNPQNISAGASATYTISVSPVAGYTGDVTLSYSGVPPGTTATLTPSVIHGASGSATLSVATSSTATPQNIYLIVVTATSGSLAHTGVANLGVRTSTADWSAEITPASQTVRVGGFVSYVISFSWNATSGDVLLSMSGLPSGARSDLPPDAAVGLASETFTVSVPPGTQPGTYQLLITGIGGGIIHQGVVTLVVTP